jgi:hypothetical protein
MYVIAKGKSVSTKRGILGEGEEISVQLGGSNFEKMIELGWIVEKKDIEVKKEVIKEVVKEEIKSNEVKSNEISLGAKKKVK